MPTSKFGCRGHWFALPVTYRDEINQLYYAGKALSRAYCEAAVKCIRECAKREGKAVTGDEREFRLYRRMIERYEAAAASARRSSGE